MIVRRATLEDLEGICKIAETLRLSHDNSHKTGFLVYVLNKNSYADRLKSSDHFYVAIKDDQLVGFLMCYDNRTLRNLVKNRKLCHEDVLAKKVFEQNGKYIFGDQIGVCPDDANKAVGSALMQNLFQDMRIRGIDVMYVGILHKPVMNIVSRKFCEKFGFTHQETVKNSDGYEWGIYKIALPPATATHS